MPNKCKGGRPATGLLALLAALICLVGCTWFGSPGEAPELQLDRVWQYEVLKDSAESMVIRDGLLYFNESYTNRLKCLNPADGRLVWSSPQLQGDDFMIKGVPAFSDNRAWVFQDATNNFSEYFYIYEVSLTDGQLVRTIRLPREQYQIWSKSSVWYANKLYWRHGEGMVFKLDLTALTEVSPGLYTGTPSVILSNTTGVDQVATSPLLLEGTKLYVGSFPQQVGNPGLLSCVDLNTDTIIWQVSKVGFGPISRHPYILDGQQMYIDSGADNSPLRFACLNADTGEFIWTNDMMGSYAGALLQENRIFKTTPCFMGQNGEKTVYCADAATGEILWSYLYTKVQLGANPQLRNGILYVSGPWEMLFFDATSGELLGRDTEHCGDTWGLDRTERFGDLMIVDNGSWIYAVKMNLKKTITGKLVKE